MADKESKGLVFAKTVQKHAGRAKEKILQKVGKVDRTADEIFDDNVQNFSKQQNAANKLQKELNNYIRCVKAMQAASKTLFECMSEVYEPEWTGHDLLTVQSQNVEMLWQDLAHKLTDQVLIPLNTYQGQFPEMRKKIEKRGRKLVDYDGQRHTFQALQTSKKREEVKITRAKEQLEEAKRTFALFNAELNEELPALYESRVLFSITNLQTLFSAEQVFHSELSKVHCELESIIEKLAKESSQRTSAHNRRSSPSIQVAAPHSPSSLNSPASDKGATTDNLPPGVLYRVRATYKYTAEDDDELALEVGDIVQVIEYEDPEEQEEGWLMGIKESTGRKGLFPANFTRPI